MSKKNIKFTKTQLEKLKQELLQVFLQHPRATFNPKQVWRKAEINLPEEYISVVLNADKHYIDETIQSLILELFQEGELLEVQQFRYKLLPAERFIEGNIQVTSKGEGYVMNEGFEEDIQIPAHLMANALNGDKVRISLLAHREGRRQQGEVVEVLSRSRTQFAGTIQHSGSYAFVVCDDPKMHVDIFIPGKQLNGARNGDKVIAEITLWSADASNPEGKIVRVLGAPGEHTAEMNAIIVEYGLPEAFPDEVEKETLKISDVISKEEIKKRRDFRKVTTFTIDPGNNDLKFQLNRVGIYAVGDQWTVTVSTDCDWYDYYTKGKD
ncbi:MAG: hypothetical protein ACO1G1_09255, partial [Bacteroidota bacterium]